MKTCPRCKQTYTDKDLNFCLDDGEMLTFADNAPPTIFMDAPRTTNPSWQPNQPIETWQNQQITQIPQYNPPMLQTIGQNQTLPIISLTLAILSLGIFCCWFGSLPLSIAALITGYLGMNNANNNPMQYGGKNIAIGGLIVGAVSLLISILMMIFGVIGSITN